MGQVIAIVSQKGGVGKTSTAVNLGACLSAIKKRVLLIELDSQGGLGKCFGFEQDHYPPGILTLLKGDAVLSSIIVPANSRLPRLFFIPSGVKDSSEETEFYGLCQEDPWALSRLVEKLRRDYDFIFFDCPPRLDNPTLSALSVSDSYLVPIQCEYASMSTIGRVLRSALDIKRIHNTKLGIFGFLLTMADKRAAFTVKVVQEVRQYLKNRVFRTIIPRDPRIAEVPFRREPVIAYDLQSPGAKAYIQLAREILGSESQRKVG